MSPGLQALDAVLALLLVGLAWRCLGSRHLFEAVVLFIALGLVLALVWVRLAAPDIALAEAALGTGVTGALLLNALRRLRRKAGAGADAEAGAGAGAHESVDADADEVEGPGGGPAAWLVTAGGAALAGGLAWLLATTPEPVVSLPAHVAREIPRSGVENPVTAVLLNFRAYDTLLEVGVLLVVAAALWALDPRQTLAGPEAGAGVDLQAAGDVPAGAAREGVLGALLRGVVPLILIVAAYLAWAGSRFPGGAFQAGALLGGGGVLLLMAGRMRLALPPVLWFRAGMVAGLALFLLVGAGALAAGAAFLEYPLGAAYPLILAIEAGLTLSIAFVLVALFAEVPALARPSPEPGPPPPREPGAREPLEERE